MKTYSLRRSALTTILLPLILTVFIALGGVSWFSYREISRIYDTRMVQLAKTLRLLTWHEVMEAENLGEVLSVDAEGAHTLYETLTAYRIWSNGILVTSTPSADKMKMTPAPSGFSTRRIEGKEWRFYVLSDPENNIVVEIAEDGVVRTALVSKILVSLMTPILVLVLCAFLIIAAGVGRALRPLNALSREVDQRDANDLHPLEGRSIPQEIAPVFYALNRLLARLGDTIKREREFTDNAAHELRTPLAALKTQAQVLAKRLPQEPHLQEGMSALLATVNRAVLLVDQMLSFARLQSQVMAFEPVNLSDILHRMREEFESAALAKEQKIQTEITDDVIIQGHAGALAILVRNLVDNAIRYTPKGGIITLTLTQNPDHIVCLSVADTGRGIPTKDKDRMFDRFTRIDTTQTGSGLGLSIVKWICDIHHATVTLEDNTPQGLKVKVWFARYK